MTTIVTILTEGFADWETALLNAVAHSFYKVETKFATPGKQPVTSSGGMTVTPELAMEELDVAAYDAIIICGGTAWQSPGAPDIAPLLDAAKAEGKLIGLICDGTVAGARAGLLDTVRHTSNGVGYLDATGYRGKALYRDTAAAVTDGKIVTAAGTSPVSFMVAVMDGLGLADDDLNYYVGMHAAQFGKAA
ncbi:MAG: glutamine amidotransferase [Devosia sp.]|uniref:DJ-1/PfpI family protein n=1 Tax=Devosia sp. TaxID=1871048 RepID=UPI00260ADC26|nr:DJ-1/PfpI family protein [Devosia sp.]MDB5539459.1 glutamine amidotransferase [Devosia sp.]